MAERQAHKRCEFRAQHPGQNRVQRSLEVALVEALQQATASPDCLHTAKLIVKSIVYRSWEVKEHLEEPARQWAASHGHGILEKVACLILPQLQRPQSLGLTLAPVVSVRVLPSILRFIVLIFLLLCIVLLDRLSRLTHAKVRREIDGPVLERALVEAGPPSSAPPYKRQQK